MPFIHHPAYTEYEPTPTIWYQSDAGNSLTPLEPVFLTFPVSRPFSPRDVPAPNEGEK